MKKLIIAIAVAALVGVGIPALACEGPECVDITNSDVSGWVYTPEWSDYREGKNGPEDAAMNTGFAGHKYDVSATGTQSADADGNGTSTMIPKGFAFQKEINGGELSGAGALTISKSSVEGLAVGIDAPDCDTGADNAKVDLEVHGIAAQANAAYSDDRDSWVGGYNESSTEYWAQTDSEDHGADDIYRYSHTSKSHSWSRDYDYRQWSGGSRGHWHYYTRHYDKISDLEADADDYLSGFGVTGGGTVVYAHQTDTNAFVGGVTANFGFAGFDNSEHRDVDVTGLGNIAGVAQIPGAGYAGFSADFNYAGGNGSYGLAAGMANVNITENPDGGVTITSTASAHSEVGNMRRGLDGPN